MPEAGLVPRVRGGTHVFLAAAAGPAAATAPPLLPLPQQQLYNSPSRSCSRCGAPTLAGAAAAATTAAASRGGRRRRSASVGWAGQRVRGLGGAARPWVGQSRARRGTSRHGHPHGSSGGGRRRRLHLVGHLVVIYALVSLLVGQAAGRERALRLGDGDSRVLARRGMQGPSCGHRRDALGEATKRGAKMPLGERPRRGLTKADTPDAPKVAPRVESPLI